MGALPVHGYNIPQLSQFWAHSDIDGTFYVINVNNVNATTSKVTVRSFPPLALLTGLPFYYTPKFSSLDGTFLVTFLHVPQLSQFLTRPDTDGTFFVISAYNVRASAAEWQDTLLPTSMMHNPSHPHVP